MAAATAALTTVVSAFTIAEEFELVTTVLLFPAFTTGNNKNEAIRQRMDNGKKAFFTFIGFWDDWNVQSVKYRLNFTLANVLNN